MFSNLWGRITGKDAKKKYPNQQTVFLGRVGEYSIISPYGLYADLPDECLLKEIGEGAAISVTVKRPSDNEQGEPVFFHPSTNTRIIARNDGNLDIFTSDSGGSVNIYTVSAVITASESVTIDSPSTTITGNLTVDGSTSLGANVTSGGTNIGKTHVHPAGTPNTGAPI
jgi:hypothetical protein